MPEKTRLQKLSRALNTLCLAIIILMPVAIVFAWMSWETWSHSLGAEAGIADALLPATLSPVQLTLGITLTLIPALVLIYGLTWLRKLFTAFADGKIFTTENTRAIRIFAWSIVPLS
jgi:hypothetical protein